MAEEKAENGGTPPGAVKQVSGAKKATPRKATKKIKEGAEQAAGGAAKAGKGARELSGEISRRVEQNVGPVAQKAKKGLTETTKKVGEEIAPAAQKAKKSLGETTKKVREEIGPAAEKARETLSRTGKKVGEEIGPAAKKAGKGLRAVFEATARATRKSARILQIRASISAELRKRQKLYARLGEAYFRAQKKQSPAKSDKDVLSSLVSDIERADTRIQALEAKEKSARSMA